MTSYSSLFACWIESICGKPAMTSYSSAISEASSSFVGSPCAFISDAGVRLYIGAKYSIPKREASTWIVFGRKTEKYAKLTDPSHTPTGRRIWTVGVE